MIKNIFIISSVLLLLSLVFFGVYNFAFEDIGKLKKEDTKEEKNELSKGEEDKKIIAISEGAVVGAALDGDGKKIRFYKKENGSVVEVTLDGSIKKTIFENDLENLSSVLWSPNRNFVISKFEEGFQNKFYLYSYITRKSTELKGGIDQIIWDNQGDKIIYKYFDEGSGERSLNVSDPNGKNWETLVTLGDEFKKINFSHVPQTLFVSFWNYPNAYEKSSLNRVNLVGEKEQEEILSGKLGADYLWSPNGRKVLVSSVSEGGKNIKLEVGEIGNKNFKDLVVPTLVDKCVWASDNENIFCSMPLDISNDAIMPNEYHDSKILTSDTFWKINIESGKKDRIIELEDLEGEYDASKLFLSEKEDFLFFINRRDEKLYRLVL